MTDVTLARPWLMFDLGREMQVLSWALNHPGFVTARRIVWREVRDADLPEGMDVRDWLDTALQAHGYADAVAFLTSRDVSSFTQSTAKVGRTTAHCVATVGLSNAERVGSRVDRQAHARHAKASNARDWGTINVAVRLNSGLTQAGMIETLSIATQARTAAIMDAGLPLSTGLATGTGTDCIAVAAPKGPQDYTGLHTDIGEAVGAAVYRATTLGARKWKSEVLPVQIAETGHA